VVNRGVFAGAAGWVVFGREERALVGGDKSKGRGGFCGMTNRRIGNGKGRSVWAERFERYGWVKFVGVLRFAQDDSQERAQQN
jgi:hypothetical protein